MVAPERMESRFKVLRIIVIALIYGVLSFAGVAIFLNAREGGFTSEPDPGQARALFFLLAFLGLGALTAFPFIRGQISRRLRQRWRGGVNVALEDPEMLEGFQTLTIVGAALAEGFSLFSVVVYLLTGQWLALAGTVIGLLAISRFLPNEGRLRAFAAAVAGPGSH